MSLYALNELLAGSTQVVVRLPLSGVLGLVTRCKPQGVRTEGVYSS